MKPQLCPDCRCVIHRDYLTNLLWCPRCKAYHRKGYEAQHWRAVITKALAKKRRV